MISIIANIVFYALAVASSAFTLLDNKKATFSSLCKICSSNLRKVFLEISAGVPA